MCGCVCSFSVYLSCCPFLSNKGVWPCCGQCSGLFSFGVTLWFLCWMWRRVQRLIAPQIPGLIPCTCPLFCSSSIPNYGWYQTWAPMWVVSTLHRVCPTRWNQGTQTEQFVHSSLSLWSSWSAARSSLSQPPSSFDFFVDDLAHDLCCFVLFCSVGSHSDKIDYIGACSV